MNTESLRTLADNLKEAHGAVCQQLKEVESGDLEEALQLKKLPSHFWWRVRVPWACSDAQYWYLCGTPVTTSGEKIVDYCSKTAVDVIMAVLGRLFGAESVWHSSEAGDELFVRMPPEKLLEFLKRDDVHLPAEALEESMMKLIKGQEELDQKHEELDQKHRLFSRCLDCLQDKGGNIGV